MFTRSLNLAISWARRIQYTAYCSNIQFNIILTSTPRSSELHVKLHRSLALLLVRLCKACITVCGETLVLLQPLNMSISFLMTMIRQWPVPVLAVQLRSYFHCETANPSWLNKYWLNGNLKQKFTDLNPTVKREHHIEYDTKCKCETDSKRNTQ
jgi:hypothetical protein